MPTVDVLSAAKEKVGTVELDPKVFAVKVRPVVMHEVLIMQQASQRQGTAETKEKGLVRGGGKKPWRQKGTGRARTGSSRSPLWRGGGTTFGPHPRSYAYRMPKTKSLQALRGALSAKAAAGEVVVLNEWPGTSKTKAIIELIARLELKGKALMVVDQPSEGLQRAVRNCQNVRLLPLASLNVYDVLRHRYVITAQAELPRWSKRWG